MKLIVHHLPTGCRWETDGIIIDNFVKIVEETLNKERGLFIQGKPESICFPSNILKESVVKVVE